jgi:hypothetical protein
MNKTGMNPSVHKLVNKYTHFGVLTDQKMTQPKNCTADTHNMSLREHDAK